MEQVKFNYMPWIGSKYEEGINGNRILLIGESFYKDHTYSDMSMYHPSSDEAIRKYLNGMKQITLDNVTSILTGMVGPELSQKTKEFLWDHVMMFNFIQDFLREGPQDKKRFPIESIKSGKELLIQALEAYDPDLVIICSKQIWKYYSGRYSEDYKTIKLCKSSVADFYLKDKQGVKHHCIGVHHPSVLRSHESKLEIYAYIQSTLSAVNEFATQIRLA